MDDIVHTLADEYSKSTLEQIRSHASLSMKIIRGSFSKSEIPNRGLSEAFAAFSRLEAAISDVLLLQSPPKD